MDGLPSVTFRRASTHLRRCSILNRAFGTTRHSCNSWTALLFESRSATARRRSRTSASPPYSRGAPVAADRARDLIYDRRRGGFVNSTRVFSVLSATVLAVVSLSAENWPAWRGPQS